MRESLNTVMKYISNHKYTINNQTVDLDEAKKMLDDKLRAWGETKHRMDQFEVSARRKAFTVCLLGSSIGIA